MWRRRTARAWGLEVLLGCVATLLGLWFTLNPLPESDGTELWVDVGSATAAFVALVLFRRDHPVALTLVLIPTAIVFGMPMGALPIALFAVALHRRAWVAVCLTALHAVLIAAIYRIAIGPTPAYYENTVFLVLLHVSFVAVGLLIRSHRMLVRSWADRAEQAEDGQRMRIEQARMAERERIAREMHDVLAHRISLLAVHAGALETRRDAPEPEREAARVVRQNAHDALEDLRLVIGMLREPQATDRPQPTLQDVPALVAESREAGTEVDLTVDGESAVPAGVGRHAYRIVQEALTNARKHAPGSPVRVALHAGDGLTIEVGNRLTRSGSLPGAGSGLVGLSERVSLVGGKLEHGPTAAGEFRVRAWLPWTP